MSAPNVHNTRGAAAVGQQQAQQKQQQAQHMEGHYGGYHYRAKHGEEGGSEHHHHAHGSSSRRSQSAPKKSPLTRRRPPKTRSKDVHSDEGVDNDTQDTEMGGDHMDDTNDPFDPWKHMHLRNAGQDQGSSGGSSGDSSGESGAGSLLGGLLKKKSAGGEGGEPAKPKFKVKVPSMKPRQSDVGKLAMLTGMPGAADLFAKPGQRTADALGLIGVGAGLMLHGMLHARVPLAGLMVASAYQLLQRQTLGPPALKVEDIKSMLLVQQRQVGWPEGERAKLPEAMADKPALAVPFALNACRPRTESMRQNAMDRLSALLKTWGM